MEITSKFAEKCNLTFDVRPIDNAPLRVKGEILTEGILLYSSNEDFRVDFETTTRDRYFDFKPSLNYIREIYFESIKKRGIYGKT